MNHLVNELGNVHTTTGYGWDPARVVNCHDGDTVRLDIDLGFGHTLTAYNPVTLELQWSCRVWGMNSPELEVKDPVTGKLVPNQPGVDALTFVQGLLPVGTLVSVWSHHMDSYSKRYDGSILLPNGDDLATIMISTGHAVPLNLP